MLKVDNISTGYGSLQVLNKVSLNVHKGKLVVLLGANGAGKTTTIRAIMGILPLWSGEIIFNGESISNRETYKIAKSGITYVPEEKSIFPEMTVLENLQIAIGSSKAKFVKNNKEFNKIIDIFPVLKKKLKQQSGTLSGGEQRMLTIGRALITQPKLMLLDEPSLGLSPAMSHDIFTIIKLIHQDGLTIFLIEQNANLSLKIADYGYVLENGSITLEGSSKKLISSPYIRKAYLGM